jgi:hypothetical protein
MNTEIALREFRKLHKEIVQACNPSEYPSDSTTHSLFGKAKMLVNKFYDNSLVNRKHFENELTLIKRKTGGYNNYQKLYGLEKFVANVILEDLRINEKFEPSTLVESSDVLSKKIDSVTPTSRIDRFRFWLNDHKFFSIPVAIAMGLIFVAAVIEAFVKLGILKDDTSDLQRQEFLIDNPPEFELLYSAFYPDNRDPLLKETLLDDAIGITGSYRLINKGRAIITLEKINLSNDFSIRGYFTDRIVKLPYPLSPGDTIVISCELSEKELPIIETEKALKKDVSLKCSYPVANIRFTYKFHWREGSFRKARVIIE